MWPHKQIVLCGELLPGSFYCHLQFIHNSWPLSSRQVWTEPDPRALVSRVTRTQPSDVRRTHCRYALNSPHSSEGLPPHHHILVTARPGSDSRSGCGEWQLEAMHMWECQCSDNQNGSRRFFKQGQNIHGSILSNVPGSSVFAPFCLIKWAKGAMNDEHVWQPHIYKMNNFHHEMRWYWPLTFNLQYVFSSFFYFRIMSLPH